MIIAMALNMQRGFNKGFFNYRKAIDQQFHNSLVKTLEQYYDETGHWDELYHNRRLWHDLVNRSTVNVDIDRPPMRPPREDHRPTKRRPRPQPLRDKKHRQEKAGLREKPGEKQHKRQMHRMRLLPPVNLLDLNKDIIIGKQHDRQKKIKYIRIKNADETVAYLGVFENNQHRKQDELFIANFKTMLLQLALIMAILAVIVTFPIAKYFTKLINKITLATQKIAKGDYTTRIKSQRQDELGDLATNFNLLAKTLEQNATSQKTMMADIAHELRTPIAVVLGEIEAIQDGVHQADSNTLNLLHTQMSSLVSLVEDLRDLSESDLGSLKYHMQNCDLQAIIQECYHNYELKLNQKNIQVNREINKQSCSIIGDVKRLKQLFNNLLSNAVHYTDDNGQVNIVVDCKEKDVQVIIEDSAPGLNTDQLAKIFDRWYRADKSRNRKLGGSGLGLAICQKIIDAHNGSIKAEESSLGGIRIQINLPREHIKGSKK